MGIVNASVSHATIKLERGERSLKKSKFMTLPQEQPVSVASADFEDVTMLRVTGTPQAKSRRTVSASHKLTISDDWRGEVPTRKKRTRTCKVCSLLRRSIRKSAVQTSWCCEPCSQDSAKLWLHKAALGLSNDNRFCFEIWHEQFYRGREIPSTITNSIQLRRLPTKPLSKRATPNQTNITSRAGRGGTATAASRGRTTASGPGNVVVAACSGVASARGSGAAAVQDERATAESGGVAASSVTQSSDAATPARGGNGVRHGDNSAATAIGTGNSSDFDTPRAKRAAPSTSTRLQKRRK